MIKPSTQIKVTELTTIHKQPETPDSENVWIKTDVTVEGSVKLPDHAYWSKTDNCWIFLEANHVKTSGCQFCDAMIDCAQEVRVFPDEERVLVIHEPSLGEDYDPSKAN